MIRLAPSVYAADYIHLEQQLAVMEQHGVTQLHIDIMDGNFVPNLSFGPDFVAGIRPYTKMKFDVHLMIREPIRFVEDFAKAGADTITVHLEACSDLTATLDLIQGCQKEAGVVLRPGIPLSELGDTVLWRIQVLQLMTVPPGLKGQHFLPESIGKIREAYRLLRRAGSQAEIEVDGDITPEIIRPVIAAGADILVAGKGLFTGSLDQRLDCYLNCMKQAKREDMDCHEVFNRN